MHLIKNLFQGFGGKHSRDSFDASKITRWGKSCGAIASDLMTAETQTEKDFLKLGDNLQDYYTRAQNMNSLSGVIVELMTGQEMINAGVELHATLEKLKNYLNDSVSQFGHMQDMYHEHAKDLVKAVLALESFQQLSLNLNILGFLIRVETAHIDNENSGFAALAGDVKKVSESIKEKVGIIHNTCDFIAAGVNSTIEEVRSFSLSHIKSAHSKLEEAVKNESFMNEKVSNARDSASVINEHITQIGQDISNIVMSQQFHDITRQRMEHVRSVLEHLQIRLNEPSSPPEQIGVMIDTIGLQSAQLTHAYEEFSEAMGNLIGNLHTLSQNVHEITEGIEGVAWISDKSGASTLMDTKASIQAIIDHIKLMSTKQKELNDKAIEVSAKVAAMSTFVNDIHVIGLNLEFLALNARIKAAHLGEEGVALDTISGGVYELSRSTRTNTAALTNILNNLATMSEDFSQDLESRQESNAQILHNLMEKLINLTDILSNIGEQVREKTLEISRLGILMERDITNTVSGIKVHKHIEKVLTEASERMKDMAREGEQAFPGLAKGSATEFLKEIDQMYTMHSERDVHTRHLGEKPEEDNTSENEEESSNIEFF